MKLRVRKVGSAAVVDLSGKLMGGPDADRFKAAVKQLVTEGYKNILVNLADVPWVNSTGLGILIAGYASLKREGGNLKLVNVTDRIQSILMITKLGTIFETYEDEQEALASFTK
jgi:anti-sigma B factor antagonist